MVIFVVRNGVGTISLPTPLDEPPPLKGQLVDGHPTPSYVLAWVCPKRKFYENLGGGRLGTVSNRNFSDVVSRNWCARPEFGLVPAPLPYPGADGNFYLIAMFNKPNAGHPTRACNVDNSVIESARVAMGVNLDLSLENTLMWYRWPLHWLHAEVRAREQDLDRLEELAREQNESRDSAPTSPPQVAVH
ncbi:hypothetical protein K438DRAFT_2022440 [Mycena galopus ATCC 62051]|nr:hypothetical protein K438DRAFT_2022440 [Mycena galopus ATCC 62051]